MSKESYEQLDRKYIEKTNSILQTLPPFVETFVYSIENTVLPKTVYSYVFDIQDLFQFLLLNNPDLEQLTDINTEYLNNLDANDLNEYLHKKRNSLGDKALARKVSSIRRFFKFMYQKHYITNKDFYDVEMPRISKNNTIVYLNPEEVQYFLSCVDSGQFLTDKARLYHDKFKSRDLAILSLMLGTGIRVSECVGLDMADISLKNNSIHIIRKGKKEENVFFADYIHDYLADYIMERKYYTNLYPGDEKALFISRQNRRISVRGVQKLVSKYACPSVVGNKHITAHKLRSSYGTNLYETTGDIYLVADILGHESVETTKKFYSAQSVERKRAAGAINVYDKNTNI